MRFQPLVVPDACVAAGIAAVARRCLPECQRVVEALIGGMEHVAEVCDLIRSVTLVEGIACLRVRRRFTEVLGDLRLDLWPTIYACHFIMQVGCFAYLGSIQVSEQPVMPSVGITLF